MADTLTSLPVKTKNAGDVSININQTTPGTTNGVVVNAALPAGTNLLGKVGIDQTTPGTTNGVQITGPGVSTANPLFAQSIGVYNSTPPTLTNGSASVVQLDTNGNVKVTLSSGSVALATGTNSIGTVGLNTGTNSIGTVGLNAGTNLIGKFGIDQTTPGTTNGVQINAALPTGSNVIGAVTQSGTWNVGLAAGSASVGTVGLNTGVNSIGTVGINAGTNIIGKFGIDQTTPGTSNAVQLSGPGTSSGNPIYVNTGAGTTGTIKNSGQIATATIAAAGGTAVASAAAITTGKIGSLDHVSVSSAGPFRFDIQVVSNAGTATTYYTYFTNAAKLNEQFTPTPGGELTLPAADGTNAKYQVVCTNLDSTAPNPAYVTIAWIEN